MDLTYINIIFFNRTSNINILYNVVITCISYWLVKLNEY